MFHAYESCLNLGKYAIACTRLTSLAVMPAQHLTARLDHAPATGASRDFPAAAGCRSTRSSLIFGLRTGTIRSDFVRGHEPQIVSSCNVSFETEI